MKPRTAVLGPYSGRLWKYGKISLKMDQNIDRLLKEKFNSRLLGNSTTNS